MLIKQNLFFFHWERNVDSYIFLYKTCNRIWYMWCLLGSARVGAEMRWQCKFLARWDGGIPTADVRVRRGTVQAADGCVLTPARPHADEHPSSTRASTCWEPQPALSHVEWEKWKLWSRLYHWLQPDCLGIIGRQTLTSSYIPIFL